MPDLGLPLLLTGRYWSFQGFSLTSSYPIFDISVFLSSSVCPKQKHYTSNAAMWCLYQPSHFTGKIDKYSILPMFCHKIVKFVNWLGVYLFCVWVWVAAIVDWSLLIILRTLDKCILPKTKTLHKQCSHHILLIKYASNWYYKCLPKIIVTFVKWLGIYLFRVWGWVGAIVDWSLLIILGTLVNVIPLKTKTLHKQCSLHILLMK